MSSASCRPDSSAFENAAVDELLYGWVQQLPSWLVTTGRAAGFWTAVVLPLLYPPLLAAGLDTVQGLLVFLGLLAVNVAALVAGRNHHRE